MTLSFQTKWPERMGELAGQPNYFIEKIWSGLKFDDPREWSILHSCYLRECKLKTGKEWGNEHPNIARSYHPKLHTIRKDSGNRWKPGMDIHFVINNRTKNRFQFAPIIPCESIQKIEIRHESRWKGVLINGWPFYEENELYYTQREAMNTLALNDGFPTVEAFFDYFNEDFEGKLIHWTDLKY